MQICSWTRRTEIVTIWWSGGQQEQEFPSEAKPTTTRQQHEQQFQLVPIILWYAFHAT